MISESDASRSTGSEGAGNYNGAAGACLCRELLMMMSCSLTTHQPFWVISVIKVR